MAAIILSSLFITVHFRVENSSFFPDMVKRLLSRTKKDKYSCGNCSKGLGKGSRHQPSIWCHICGWVHFKCSGLNHVSEYEDLKDNFLCIKCSRTRRLVPETRETIAFSKLHDIYTNCSNPASFGNSNSLKKESKCTLKDVENYLREARPTQNSNKRAKNSLDLKYKVTD